MNDRDCENCVHHTGGSCSVWECSYEPIEDDLISRKAAIEILYNFAGCIVDTPNGDYRKAYEASRYELETLPSAQPEQHWIPCSERLPEDGQDVLVTYKTTDKIHPCQYHDDGSRNPWYSYIDQCRAYMNVVLAWMPLPKPYKEDES